MFLSIEQKVDYVLIHLHGRLDSFNLQIVEDKLKTLVKAGKLMLAIEMKNVEFVSLATIIYLDKLAGLLKDQGGQILIFGENQSTNLIKKVRIENISIFADEEFYQKSRGAG